MSALTNWLNKMVKIFAFLFCVLFLHTLRAQSVPVLTLQQAFSSAEKAYPVSNQKTLLQQSEELNNENLNTGYLPQFNINAQASYQSDVTKINIPITGIKVPEQSKDQYKAYADVSQLLFDGGLIKEQKRVQQLSTSVEESKVNVELYNLKSRINTLYFSILYQQEVLNQTNLLLADIETGIGKVTPQVENGTTLRSNLLVLQAQQLQTRQRAIDIQQTKKGLLNALSVLLNIPLTESTQLQKPSFSFVTDTVIARPELVLYSNQSNLLQQQKNLISTKNLPKLSAFAQGGYGRPALNLLSNQFDPYYIAGLRLNWSLGSLYTAKHDKALLSVNQRSVDIQKETFLLNTQSQLSQQAADIGKYTSLINSDMDIIAIRKKITEAAKAQLDNAVITTNDYLKEINAEDEARLSLIIHQLQLLQSEAAYAITAGKL